MNPKIAELEASSSRKRPRHEESEPQSQTLSSEEDFSFSDTLMALRMMRAQFPHIDKVSVPPFVLQSQLYSSINDRTQVDRDIEIERVVKRMEDKKQNDLAVFEWFKTHVEQSKLDTSIGHQELCSLLSFGGKIRQLLDQNMYWFSIPNIGSVLKGLSQGRKELLSLLSRRKYKEMAMSSLEKKRLRFSCLDMRFHIRDLIGSGQLKTIQTPSGLIVRVAKD